MNTSYAVLGATGNIGQSLLKVLEEQPNKDIHAFVRSKSKLERLSPAICSKANVKIFQGNITDISTLKQCLQGTRAAFLAVAVTDNIPGCSIAQDTARCVVAALQELKEEAPYSKLPRLIVLSSASLNDKFWRDIPHILHKLMSMAASYVYEDLAKAEEYLRSQGDWISSTFVKPGGLVHDAQKGYELSTERQQTFLSYLDLAAGMVEIADTDGDVWNMEDVSVLPTAKDVKIEWWVLWFLVKGWLYHFFPSVYPWL